MDDEQELLPEELDALLDDLQKGASAILPSSQQPAADFLGDLVQSARASQLDPHYMARLDQRLKRSAALMLTAGMTQAWRASLRASQPWRRLALAFASVILVSVLALSSMFGPRTQPLAITPPLPDSAWDGLAPAYLTSSLLLHETPSRINTTPGDKKETAAIQAVQAPDPPNTPLPMRTTPGEIPIRH